MVKGRVVIDKKTKELVQRIKAGEIGIINHRDIDQIAAKTLIEKNIIAVINTDSSLTGRYLNKGPELLINAGITVIDILNKDILYNEINEGDYILIKDNKIYKNCNLISTGIKIDQNYIKKKMIRAKYNLNNELNDFIENTLLYARKEKELILDLKVPDINLDINKRQVLIVVRGAEYKDDLRVISSYVKDLKPIIIAVDGGADACLEFGYIPDIVIGDMDSISDNALKKVIKRDSILIVHAYPDGRAPGLKRLKKMNINPIIFPAPGTSEDIAMLLAYEKGAELITAVGTHSNMIDFLEKDRPGMGSTLLARMKIGNKLIDAKGVSKLYHVNLSNIYFIPLFLAFLLPVIITIFFSTPLKQLIQLFIYKITLLIH